MADASQNPQPTARSRPLSLDLSHVKSAFLGAMQHPVIESATKVSAWHPPSVEELAEMLPGYLVESMIGKGGMGAVYQAVDAALRRRVAIKILPPELLGLPGFKERFQREARTMAQFTHPNIVTIYDLDELPGGLNYFVMEYVEGSDLKQLLHPKGKTEKKSPLEPQAVFALLLQVVKALCVAHQRGIIHRDIKPANILVRADGTVKVGDFGLAIPVSEHALAQRCTGSAEVLGTREYMAPELLEGAESDPRADIYAVGVLCYEMLTGTLPRGAFLPASQRVAVDKRVDRFITRAMQPDPAQRFQEMSQVLGAVEKLLYPKSSGVGKKIWIAAAIAGCLGGAGWGYVNAKQKPINLSPPSPKGDIPAAKVATPWPFYEPFDEAPGDNALVKKKGYEKAAHDSSKNADIIAGSLEYVDAAGNRLRTKGNAVLVDAHEETATVSNTRPLRLPESLGSSLWLSFLGQQVAGDTTRFFNFGLRGADNTIEPADYGFTTDELIAYGMQSGTPKQVWQIWDRSTGAPLGRMASSEVMTTQVAFVVGRIDLNVTPQGQERFLLWVNPRLDVAPVDADAVSFTSTHSNFPNWQGVREFRLGAGFKDGPGKSTGWIVDEIRLGESWLEVMPIVPVEKTR